MPGGFLIFRLKLGMLRFLPSFWNDVDGLSSLLSDIHFQVR